MNPQINYKEHCKLRIVGANPNFYKHELVKCLIMLICKNKYPKAGIYSEYELSNGDIPDVCIDLGNEVIYYEIQKEITNDWLNEIRDRDLDLNINTIIIRLKDLSDNLNELIKQLEEIII